MQDVNEWLIVLGLILAVSTITVPLLAAVAPTMDPTGTRPVDSRWKDQPR